MAKLALNLNVYASVLQLHLVLSFKRKETMYVPTYDEATQRVRSL